MSIEPDPQTITSVTLRNSECMIHTKNYVKKMEM